MGSCLSGRGAPDLVPVLCSCPPPRLQKQERSSTGLRPSESARLTLGACGPPGCFQFPGSLTLTQHRLVALVAPVTRASEQLLS